MGRKLNNPKIELTEQERELLLKFITEDYNCKMELIVDTPENIIEDVIKYRGFTYNLYKRIIDKVLILEPLENEEDGKNRGEFYIELIGVMAKIMK